MKAADQAVKRRQAFAVALAKRISPAGMGITLSAINDALPALTDLPDAAFGQHMPAFIAPKCSALPDAQELRTLLLDALRNLTPKTPQSGRATPGEHTLPSLPLWLIRKIREQCGSRPGPMLRDWLLSHGEDPAHWA